MKKAARLVFSTLTDIYVMNCSRLRYIVILCLIKLAERGLGLLQNPDPDLDLLTPEFVVRYGYPVEIHDVVTEDGYILQLHRIPRGKHLPSAHRGPPVLLQHGILASSADWIVMGPEKSLGFILADAGYDVWIGNARGNTYSRRHIHLNPSSREFWDFSWHEMGVLDLPTVIDHILNKTKQEQLFYIGHSMGTTMFYVMASERPEYNEKIRIMFSFAPIAFMSHIRSPFIRFLANIGMPYQWLLVSMGALEFLPHSQLMSDLQQVMCKNEAPTHSMCLNAIFLITGFDSQQINMTRLPVYLGHVPAGASMLELLHYAQGMNSGNFQKLDHGSPWANMEVYGQSSPPIYDLSKVTAPVALHYGDNDWLAAIEDVTQLYWRLGNPVGMFRIPYHNFNHVDYLWGDNARKMLYNSVMNIMLQY